MQKAGQNHWSGQKTANREEVQHNNPQLKCNTNIEIHEYRISLKYSQNYSGSSRFMPFLYYGNFSQHLCISSVFHPIFNNPASSFFSVEKLVDSCTYGWRRGENERLTDGIEGKNRMKKRETEYEKSGKRTENSTKIWKISTKSWNW